MNMKPKPVVGQTLYERSVGSYSKSVTLKPVVVKKVGRKYFEAGEVPVTSWGDKKYHLDNWFQCTDYCPTSKLYTSEQEYVDELEAALLAKQIADCFPYERNARNLTLGQLRAIMAIICPF